MRMTAVRREIGQTMTLEEYFQQLRETPYDDICLTRDMQDEITAVFRLLVDAVTASQMVNLAGKPEYKYSCIDRAWEELDEEWKTKSVSALFKIEEALDAANGIYEGSGIRFW